MISQGLEGFLNWLRETEQQLHMAEQWEQEANDATQDILHRLELGELAAEDAGRLALKLREVRQKRREAKDLLDQAGPVADWLESRRAVVKELEQLLGGVRKAERRSRDRIYTPKTNILEENGTWNGCRQNASRDPDTIWRAAKRVLMTAWKTVIAKSLTTLLTGWEPSRTCAPSMTWTASANWPRRTGRGGAWCCRRAITLRRPPPGKRAGRQNNQKGGRPRHGSCRDSDG